MAYQYCDTNKEIPAQGRVSARQLSIVTATPTAASDSCPATVLACLSSPYPVSGRRARKSSVESATSGFRHAWLIRELDLTMAKRAVVATILPTSENVFLFLSPHKEIHAQGGVTLQTCQCLEATESC